MMDIVYLGWIATCLYFISGFYKSPKITVTICVIGNLLFITKYYLTGDMSPSVSMCCMTTAALFTLYSPAHFRKYIAPAAFLSSSYLILMSFSNTIDLLIILANACIAVSQFRIDSYVIYKTMVMGSQFLWIAFSLSIGDYAMITSCLSIVVANAYSLHTNLLKDYGPSVYKTFMANALKGRKPQTTSVIPAAAE